MKEGDIVQNVLNVPWAPKWRLLSASQIMKQEWHKAQGLDKLKADSQRERKRRIGEKEKGRRGETGRGKKRGKGESGKRWNR